MAAQPTLEVSIPSTEQRLDGKKTYTVYKVVVTLRNGDKEFFRRYSEFHAVYKALKERNVGELPAYFPSKQVFGNQKASTIEKRRISLQVFLNQVLTMPNIFILCPELTQFLELSPTEGTSGFGGPTVAKRVARAAFPFDGVDDTDLTFKEGDIILVHDDSDADGWWIGELNGKCGTFPHNYVTLIASTGGPAPIPPELADTDRQSRMESGTRRADSASKNRSKSRDDERESVDDGYPRVRALFPYEGNSETDLSFPANAIITVTEIDEESGWWFGNLDDRMGLFPSNFVELINDLP